MSMAPRLALLWIAPLMALACLQGLLLLGGQGGTSGLALPVVGASVLAGMPAAVLAIWRRTAALPAALAASAGAALGGAVLARAPELAPPDLVAGASAAAALAVLWVALGLASAREAVPALLAAALIALCSAVAGGLAPGLGGLALGAGSAAMMAAAPAAAALEPRQRGFAGPLAFGLLAALAVLAAPAGALLGGTWPMVPVLGLVVALPGLGLLAAARQATPRLAAALLVLEGCVVVLGLAALGLPAALGLLPGEALLPLRFALLGAAFLPAFATLLAERLAHGEVAGVAFCLAVLTLGGLAAGLWPGAVALHGIGYLAAPVLATGLAVLLALWRKRA